MRDKLGFDDRVDLVDGRRSMITGMAGTAGASESDVVVRGRPQGRLLGRSKPSSSPSLSVSISSKSVVVAVVSVPVAPSSRIALIKPLMLNLLAFAPGVVGVFPPVKLAFLLCDGTLRTPAAAAPRTDARRDADALRATRLRLPAPPGTTMTPRSLFAQKPEVRTFGCGRSMTDDFIGRGIGWDEDGVGSAVCSAGLAVLVEEVEAMEGAGAGVGFNTPA